MALDDVMVVSGTSRGIGRALVDYYLDRGWHIAGISRSPSSIRHERYFHFEGSVGVEKDVVNFFQKVRERSGKVRVLINNAGIAYMNHALTIPADNIRRTLEVNVGGTMLMSREAAKIMIRNKNGRIINTSSIAVPLQLEGEAVYAASKAAVESYTKTLARELAPFQITVNALGLPPIQTDLIKGVPDEKIESIVDRQIIKRLGKMTDVINATNFLLREESHFITGEILYMGGV